MKKLYALLCMTLFVLQASAQSDSTHSHTLNKTETDDFFTAVFKKKNLINFPIFRAYTYSDKSGTYYVALSESSDKIKAKDTINNSIKAFNFKADKGVATKKWEINDFKLPDAKGATVESSIWFWTKYCEFTDLDGDGLIEPIIVYGTFGNNGYDDGRLKILIYYKGQKTAIRHQNGVLDGERKTQVDLTFYSLPTQVQAHVKELMEKMVKNNHAIFPSKYLDKMAKKTTQIVD
ncbi:M949_RS01915 family surface polysaccharide biosynthesis protein [Pedobacter sp. ASV12]|uniref:M949_RS01915 family surface polysaccharide biosynthesis protein n=1 Tax=Pedobacter sp. ASV12 TaxID=2795120 RepID=UPI0018EAABFB|nr:hypothetical protein [Pedobacter sp. ASV12]